MNNARDPELHATRVKQVIITEVIDARKSKEPEDQISIIVTTLNRGGPIGSYGPVYTQLKEVAEPLLVECEQTRGVPENLGEKLNELLAVAAQLPGDLKPLD